MSRIIGDRKEKSALDEMEEVARARNRDVAEEERIEAEKKAKREADRKAREEAQKKNAEEKANAPSEEPAGRITPPDYSGLEFEPKNSHTHDDSTYIYDDSLKRIKKAKYRRHPAPSEVFTLLADNLEGKLTGNLKAAADEMVDDLGEWLSMSMKRRGDILICYLHPNLKYQNGRYHLHGKYKCEFLRMFNVAGKSSEECIPLNKFDDDFVKFVYGRIPENLPKEMMQGKKKATVLLPKEGIVSPVSRYMSIDGRYSISACIQRWVSRGVRHSEETIDMFRG
jgi:hypothetical protein